MWKEKRSRRRRKKKGRRKKWRRKEEEEENEEVEEGGGRGTVTADVPFCCWDKTQTNNNLEKERFSFNL